MENKFPKNKNQLKSTAELMDEELIQIEDLFNKFFSQYRKKNQHMIILMV